MREKNNYYFLLAKNSLEHVKLHEIKVNNNGSLTVKDRSGNSVNLVEEKDYKATIFHQEVYDSKGNFIGVKSMKNGDLNRKFKSLEGNELVTNQSLSKVITDIHNRGTYNWDNENNVPHLLLDVNTYNEYGSGLDDTTTKKQRKREAKFIQDVWSEIVLSGNRLERYIDEKKIKVITPKVLYDFQHNEALKLKDPRR